MTGMIVGISGPTAETPGAIAGTTETGAGVTGVATGTAGTTAGIPGTTARVSVHGGGIRLPAGREETGTTLVVRQVS